MSTSNTVRVRIFVSVAPCGDYIACGQHCASDTELRHGAMHEPCDAGYWIEADLPVPGSQPTITATVTRA